MPRSKDTFQSASNLNEEGVVYQTHVKPGDVGETFVSLAEQLACDHIVMGARGPGAIAGKVLHLAKIPVVCVKSEPPRTAPA